MYQPAAIMSDVLIAMISIGPDQEIYWATQVPITAPDAPDTRGSWRVKAARIALSREDPGNNSD